MKRCLFLLLILSNILLSCKKGDDKAGTNDRKVEYKTVSSHTNIGNITYTNVDGIDKSVVGEKTDWSSGELIIPQSVSLLNIKAETPAYPNAPATLTVRIYVNGELKKEVIDNTANNMGKLIATATYSF